MRESNFSQPNQNRACVCISSALYDRRAIDAPSPSLPLVNSLTHLSYLTATSPRIREILSLDGGLERIVKILKNCADGPAPAIEETLSQMKGKGTTLAKGARKSPFKPFSSYSTSTPSTSLVNINSNNSNEKIPKPLKIMSTQSKHLLYTYTLAFQCLVNIGVRGSEQIRTRVVEAGALDVVIHVLETYLADIDRKRSQSEDDHLVAVRGVEITTTRRNTSNQAQPVTRPLLEQLQTSTAAAITAITTAITITPTRNQSQLVIAAAAGNRSPNGLLLPPPSRVSTPETVASMDDDVAESSGQEADGDGDGTECDETASNGELASSLEERRASRGKGREEIEDDDVDDVEQVDENDQDGDVRMEGPEEEQDRRESATPRAAPRNPLGSSNNSQPRSSNPTSSDEGLKYGDTDVLLSLQLLAYLSKYPHVRNVFHSPSEASEPTHICGPTCTHNRFDLPTLPLPRRRDQLTPLSNFSSLPSIAPTINNTASRFAFTFPQTSPTTSVPSPSVPSPSTSTSTSRQSQEHSHSHAHHSHSHSHCHPSTSSSSTSSPAPNTLPTNVFSLVEAFTHRPPSSDKFTPRHSNEVQYWAGVIMRNACRKDETQKGIRQCANMLCGIWEKTPREFAKCRRCRKAKYCSKACQSTAWSQGHKFWCTKANNNASGATGESSRSRGHHNHEDTQRTRDASAAQLLGPPPARRLHRDSRPPHSTHSRNDHRPNNTNSITAIPPPNYEDEDEEEEQEEEDYDDLINSAPTLPDSNNRLLRLPPPTGLATAHGLVNPFLDQTRTGGAGGGGGMEVDLMDENEVAQGMMGGTGVFGEMGTGTVE